MKLFKTLLTILVISLLSSPSWSATMDDLVKRDDLYYEKFTDVPFTGKLTGRLQGSFKTGKREGAWVSYRENGQLMYKENFKNDKKEGAWLHYWDNGQLSDKGNNKNGKQEGAWAAYNKVGTLDQEFSGTYKEGVKISD